MEQFDGEKFIKTVLVEDIEVLVNNERFHYLAFLIIGSGIELLGSFLDEEDFDTSGISGKRFKEGLKLMGQKYADIEDILWNDLRCGLAHNLKPKKRINLTGYNGNGKEKIHLYKGDKSGMIYIIISLFFADFKAACQKMIDKLKDSNNGEITNQKKSAIHLNVIQIKLEEDIITGELKEIII